MGVKMVKPQKPSPSHDMLLC